MTSRTRIWILAAINLVGALVALFQSQHFYMVRQAQDGVKTFCQIGVFDCVAIEASPWAEFIFGLPLSAFVSAWLLSIAVIALLSLDSSKIKEGSRILFSMAGFGFLVGLFYLYIMVSRIGSLCLLCLTIDVINLINVFLTFSLFREFGSKTEGFGPSIDFKKWVNAAFITGGLAIGTSLFVIGAFKTPSALNSTELDHYASRFADKPEVKVIGDSLELVMGDESAPIKIYKYSDFLCPACAQSARVLKLLMQRYPNKIQVILRNYPLDNACNPKMPTPMHPDACLLAKAAICAYKKGKLTDAYQLFFESQKDLSQSWLEKNAVHFGYDSAELKSCMADPSVEEKLKRDLASAATFDLKATPTLIVNGRLIEGGYPIEIWERVIDKLLK